jgi:hypothetical protein
MLHRELLPSAQCFLTQPFTSPRNFDSTSTSHRHFAIFSCARKRQPVSTTTTTTYSFPSSFLIANKAFLHHHHLLLSVILLLLPSPASCWAHLQMLEVLLLGEGKRLLAQVLPHHVEEDLHPSTCLACTIFSFP